MLERVKAQLGELSAAERKVAELVLSQPYTVMQAAVADIAASAGVSQPTVIRFCRSLGCGGLPDFKLKLAASLVGGVPYVHASVRPEDPTSEIVAKVFDNTVSALLKCRNEVSPATMEQAVALLSAARRVEFYGVGNSGIIACDAQHKFFRFGIHTVAYTDTHIQTMAASVLTADDVLVVISNSGRTLDLLSVTGIAQQNGAKVIAITAPGTPLARKADVALTAKIAEDAEIYSPMISRIVHLVLIDSLAVSVALRRGPGLIANLEKAKRSMRDKRQYD